MQRAASTSTPTSKEQVEAGIQNRLKQDTVLLSADGQKIVNLNRGAALGQEIKSAAVDQSFAEKLWNTTQDVFRVGKIFQQTSRSLFGWWKR
ncbi:MAG: hypothetical protein VW338_04275 [Rhodospirillaceae bacterium]